ncbi:outer membrane beta-barrel protein [Sphingobacterium sp. MYb382]
MKRKMEQKENKELIEHIKAQLKAFEETPYRQGAWESYKAAYEAPTKTRRLAPVYWSAAAAVLLLGFGGLFFYKQNNAVLPVGGNTPAITAITPEVSTDSSPLLTPKSDDPAVADTGDIYATLPALGATTSTTFNTRPEERLEARHTSYLSTAIDTHRAAALHTDEVKSMQYPINSPVLVHHDAVASELGDVDLGAGFVMAQKQADLQNYKESNNLALTPKKLKIVDKLELGAFLSPTGTTSKLDLGGGLILGYQLSKKVTLRTGAAFNQYEVGILPSQMNGKQGSPSFDSPVTNGLMGDVPYRSANAALPNINAVTGKVQTLDIPIEVQYKIDNKFYTSVGVSYAAVLSQERFNHYQEKAGAAVFSSESDAGKQTNEVRTVAKKVSSEVDNVGTNGFGGFINLSVGRKTNVTRGFKVSVEPFVKIPVGQFKRADMNYTNGGIKVITNF